LVYCSLLSRVGLWAEEIFKSSASNWILKYGVFCEEQPFDQTRRKYNDREELKKHYEYLPALNMPGRLFKQNSGSVWESNPPIPTEAGTRRI